MLEMERLCLGAYLSALLTVQLILAVPTTAAVACPKPSVVKSCTSTYRAVDSSACQAITRQYNLTLDQIYAINWGLDCSPSNIKIGQNLCYEESVVSTSATRRLTMGAFEYFILASPMGAAEAQAVCADLGGNLASVHSEEENVMLHTALVLLAVEGGASTKDGIFGWLGITVDRQGVASNLDGTKVDFTKWSSVGGDPNDYTTAAGGTSCVHFGRFEQWLEGGSWGDTNCRAATIEQSTWDFHPGFPVCKRALRNTTGCAAPPGKKGTGKDTSTGTGSNTTTGTGTGTDSSKGSTGTGTDSSEGSTGTGTGTDSSKGSTGTGTDSSKGSTGTGTGTDSSKGMGTGANTSTGTRPGPNITSGVQPGDGDSKKKDKTSDGAPLGLILGAAIGGVILAAVVLASVFFVLKKKKAATAGSGKLAKKGKLPHASTNNFEPRFEERPQLDFGGKPPV